MVPTASSGLHRMPPGRRFRRAWRWSAPWVPATPLVAGLVHGMSLDWTPEQTLRLATAVSALAVSQVAVGFNDINVLKPLLEQVRVQRLDDLAPTQPQPHLMANSGDAQ